MTAPSESLTYRDAGVDIDAGDALVERIKPYARRTMRPGVLAGIGGFGALFEVPKGYAEPVLVSAEDVDGLMDVIRSVHEDEGRTVLMVEHRMEVVVGLAQRIAVMHHGALLAFDTPERVMADETVQTAYLGEPL